VLQHFCSTVFSPHFGTEEGSHVDILLNVACDVVDFLQITYCCSLVDSSASEWSALASILTTESSNVREWLYSKM
jgi:hypothetical protein